MSIGKYYPKPYNHLKIPLLVSMREKSAEIGTKSPTPQDSCIPPSLKDCSDNALRNASKLYTVSVKFEAKCPYQIYARRMDLGFSLQGISRVEEQGRH